MDTFPQLITYLSTYQTSPATRVLALPKLQFYPRLIRIVYRSSRQAKHGSYSRNHWSQASVDILRMVERCGGKFHISGLQHLHRLKPPVVFVGNHMSTLETFILPVLLLTFTDVAFAVKRSLTTYPVFGHVMRAVEPIVVDRVKPKDDLVTVLNEGTAWLERGRSVIIFPQATRSATIDRAKFNSLGVKLAQRARVPVVPIALKTDFWGNGRLVKDFGAINPSKRIRIEFGTPLEVDKNTHEAVFSFIAQRLSMWQNET